MSELEVGAGPLGYDSAAASSELVLQGITKVFGSTVAVDSLDLAVARGAFVTVLGPSGCGKTTLLRMIGGFIEPDAGQILIDGEDVRATPVERRPTAMLFQGYSLWPHLNVTRNISFGLELRRRPRAEIAARVAELLELVGLRDFGTRLPSELSGGQQQRVALARALSLEPRILLLDEPFSSLDLKLRIELRSAVRAVQRAVGTTTLLVTHDQDEALELSDSIVVMSAGHIEQIGTPAEVYEQPRSRFVAEFIGTMTFLEATLARGGVELDSRTLVPVEGIATAPRAGVGRVTVGVRPEDVRLVASDDAGASATVEAITLRGHYRELALRIGECSLRAYTDRDSDLEIGAQVRVSFRRVRGFDDGRTVDSVYSMTDAAASNGRAPDDLPGLAAWSQTSPR